MSMAANFGGIGNDNPSTFPALWLGTFAPRIGKALYHAGATYYIMQQWLTGCGSLSIRGKRHIYVSAVWSRALGTIVQLE